MLHTQKCFQEEVDVNCATLFHRWRVLEWCRQFTSAVELWTGWPWLLQSSFQIVSVTPASPSFIVFFGCSLPPSISSLFLLPAAALSLGAPPLNLGSHILVFPTEACVCGRELTVAQEEGGSLCSPQLKGRGITGTQTLIKAFQPPMAPLIQS